MIQEQSIEQYVTDSPYLLLFDEEIQNISNSLVMGCKTEVEKVEKIFVHVRDTYLHSMDAKETIVSISAKDVIKNGHGICYAKSNLLAALLRCQQIPTGYCYQRLTLEDDDTRGYCLHALNAVYINNQWHRLDARGNKPGVNVQFSLSKEQVAFPIRTCYKEIDYPTIYVNPLPCTIDALLNSENVSQLMNHLPNNI